MSLSSKLLRAGSASILATSVMLAAPPVLAQGSSPVFNYMQHCVGCHLPDGSGFPPEVPDLRREFAYLIDSEPGRDFMMRVPGVIGAPLEAEEVADLLNWMIATFYPAAGDFEPVTAQEVLAGRKAPLHDPLKARKQLLGEHVE